MTSTDAAAEEAEAASPALLVSVAAVPLGPRPWRCAPGSTRRPKRDPRSTTAPRHRPRRRRCLARHAKADNTRRAYRAGVRAWCAWCDRHALPCLPGQRRRRRRLPRRRARPRPVASPPSTAPRRHPLSALHRRLPGARPPRRAVAETMAGIHRHAAERGRGSRPRNSPPPSSILREILAPIGDDLRRPARPRAAAGRLRRRAAPRRTRRHPGRAPRSSATRGLRLTLPRSKGDRDGKAVTVAIPYGSTELCPVRALRRWQDAAGITDGRGVPAHLGAAAAERATDGNRSPPCVGTDGHRSRHRRPHHPGPRRRRRFRSPRHSAATASSAAP